MSRQRDVLEGPNGIRLIGPDEHPGEHRYSWLDQRTHGPTTLVLRVEKQPGIAKTYDCQSPLVQMVFAGKGLLISLAMPSQVPGFKYESSSGLINPYLNRVQKMSLPVFEIPLANLTADSYDVSYETNFRGNFLVLEKRSGTMVIIINLWALAMFEGLQRITLDGEFFFEDTVVGTHPTAHNTGTLLPIFCVLGGRRTVSLNSIDSLTFETESYTEVQRILGAEFNKDRGQYPVIDGFRNIDMNVNGDRVSGIYEELLAAGRADARALFKQIFPN